MILKEENIVGEKEDNLRNKMVLSYLRKYKNEFNLNLHFNIGCEEVDESQNYKTKGRLDFVALYPVDCFGKACEDKYFTFECKRLKNNSKNRSYIEEGMNRYIEEKYPTKILPLAGMIAFVEKGNIQEIVNDINRRLLDDYKYSNNEVLFKEVIEKDFEYSYLSKHNKNNNSKVDIYHLMLDISLTH